MYTICYVLTDNKELNVFQELLISVESLLLHGHPNKVLVLTERSTMDQIGDLLTKEMAKRDVEVVVTDVPQELSLVEKSRYIKTKMRSVVSGDILYVDTDTIFVRNLPEHISNSNLALVPDYHLKSMNEFTSCARNSIITKAQSCGLTIDPSKTYFNGGVIWVKETEETVLFFEKWHTTWMEHKTAELPNDQFALNYINQSVFPLIEPLSDIFNVQINQGRGASWFIQYLGDAVMLHYIHDKDSSYAFTRKDIRGKGIDDPEVKELICNPYKAFCNPKLTNYDQIREDLQYTEQYKRLYSSYKKHRKVFNFFERCLRLISRK